MTVNIALRKEVRRIYKILLKPTKGKISLQGKKRKQEAKDLLDLRKNKIQKMIPKIVKALATHLYQYRLMISHSLISKLKK